MTIQEQHYDFKMKLNKVDSQQHRNLRIPEIDWKLNESIELFVKMIAEPRLRNHLGFEKTQRNIDDIRTLVVNADCLDVIDNLYVLPTNYWHYLSSSVEISQEDCVGQKGTVFIRQHDDNFETSAFDKSSFPWRHVNATFYEEGIKFYTTDFTVDTFCLNYLKKPVYVHNAADFGTGTYTLPSGTVLTGTQDCDLPEHTHREIVDLAVYLTANNIDMQNLQSKFSKLQLNQLI